MINDQRREFYSIKKLDSLYVQGTQKLSSARFMGPLVNKQNTGSFMSLCKFTIILYSNL